MGEITWGTASAVLAAPFVFLLPGWALLDLLLPPASFPGDRRPDAATRLILAVAVTLALAPLVLLFSHVVGLRLGTAATLIILALSLATIAWRRAPGWHSALVARRSSPAPQPVRLLEATLPSLVLVLFALLVLGVRVWVVRGLNVGFWGDSYQHTVMVQLLLDNGGLFDSWEPYAPLTTFTYHCGFHSNVAFFEWATGWLTGNSTGRTVVLVGQLFNALAALAVYPLAVRLSGRQWVGVLAVLIAGLLTPMPMYFVNWGRYTQLAGQIILPAATWLFMEAIESSQRCAGRLVLAAVAAAGLALAHYFVLAFYVVLVAIYLATWLLGNRERRRRWRETVLRAILVTGAAGLLILPWVVRVAQGRLPYLLLGFVQRTFPLEHIRAQNLFYPVADYVPLYLVAAGLLGGLWALLRRRWTGLLLPWVAGQLLICNPQWLGLPGQGVIDNFTLELSLYIPASILTADLVVDLWRQAHRRLPAVRPLLVAGSAVVLIGLAAVGLRERSQVLSYDHQLVTPADEAALTWVRQNTPQDARFLANSIAAFGGGLIAGSDAGWWLPLLAGRQNTIPPLTYGSEAGPDLGYRDRVNGLANRLQGADLGAAETVGLLRGAGITHVFVGEKGGPLLDVAVLRQSPFYRAIYGPTGQAAGPWVFEVVGP